MSSAQRGMIAVGLVAFAATLFMAPHSYTGHNGAIWRLDNARFEGTLYAPIWAELSGYDDAVRNAAILRRPNDAFWRNDIEDVRVDMGKLGLIWGAIALLTAAGVGLVRDTEIPVATARMRKCPDCAEQIRADARKCRFCGSILPAETKGHPLVGKKLGSLERFK